MPYSLLKENIKKYVEISNEELDTICSFFKPQIIKKKEFLLTQGDIYKFEGFVIEGCFRVFTIDKKGNENVLYFASKDWWVMDIDSFMNQKPSHLNIQALEDSKILIVNKEDKSDLYKSVPKAEKR